MKALTMAELVEAVIGHDRWYPNEAQLAMKVEAHPPKRTGPFLRKAIAN